MPGLLLALGGDTGLDSRGWHPGTPASRTAQILVPFAAQQVGLPAWMAQKVTRPTLLYYFSPSCGHCRQTIGEIVRLHGQLHEELDFIGVASAAASPEEIASFAAQFEVPFPLISDLNSEFAQTIRAQSTPTVVVLRPDGDSFLATDAYYPWFQGASLFVRFRLHPERGFDNFVADEYLGTRACSTCHDQETRSWSITHHAVAYRTLYTRDRATDPDCVSCHVTGLGSPSGMVLGEHGSVFTSVTCESCHGPSGPHDGVETDARAACQGCHDAEHSVGFSLERGLPHIDHYAANFLSEKEQDERWDALTDGSAPRPLLAFHDGPNQGSAACASCHSEQHAAWSQSPHGEARATLKRKNSKNNECLLCHATPTEAVAGKIPTQFLNEGVGCESCHGPGGAHIASPSESNILGLGESCPECVIEGVCTSCHTPKWDPSWELHTRLDAVKGHGG